MKLVQPFNGWDPPSQSLRRDRLYGTHGSNGGSRLPVFAQSQLLKGSVDIPEMLPQRAEPG